LACVLQYPITGLQDIVVHHFNLCYKLYCVRLCYNILYYIMVWLLHYVTGNNFCLCHLYL